MLDRKKVFINCPYGVRQGSELCVPSTQMQEVEVLCCRGSPRLPLLFLDDVINYLGLN